MTAKTDKRNGCLFEWKIENISHFWLREGEAIISPSFNVEALGSTKWSVRLCPMDKNDNNCIGLFIKREEDCSGQDVVEVNFRLAFVSVGGPKEVLQKQAFRKGEEFGVSSFKTREMVFFTNRYDYLPDDTLTVQCSIWNIKAKSMKPEYLYARTVLNINRRNFRWKIENFSTLKSDIRKKFKENLYELDLVLNKNLDKLSMCIVSVDDSIKYVSCTTSVINSEGKKAIIKKGNYFYNDFRKNMLLPILVFSSNFKKKKSKYMPNDSLSLDLVFSFSTIVQFGIKKYSVGLKMQKTEILSDDLKFMYNERILSDARLQTPTKTFQAHKNILSARSPVFRDIFKGDTIENKCGHTVITNLEEDIMKRMLLYIYTDSLEDLQLETSCKLYIAADKYKIISLKNRCTSFIKDNLCPSQVCNILVLADLYQNKDLKSIMESYISENRTEVLSCQEWKDFMDTNSKLAVYTMYRIVFPE